MRLLKALKVFNAIKVIIWLFYEAHVIQVDKSAFSNDTNAKVVISFNSFW